MRDPDQIEIQTRVDDDTAIVHPVGEIDLSRAPSLRHQISEVQNERPARLVIDLEEVPYMDSSGVATLVEVMQVARRQGGKLVLCRLQDKVQSIFEIARLDMVFTIVDDVDTAMKT